MKEGGGLFVRIGMMGSEVTAENRPDHRANQRPEKKKKNTRPTNTNAVRKPSL